jgi:hypothetical protein
MLIKVLLSLSGLALALIDAVWGRILDRWNVLGGDLNLAQILWFVALAAAAAGTIVRPNTKALSLIAVGVFLTVVLVGVLCPAL